jgi:hypothetical protein
MQVATRFVATCPALYWHAANMLREGYGVGVWAFFLAYTGLGLLLFCNFYPWT